MNDPWQELPPSNSANELSARRVSSELKANFFWARDAEGRNILLLEHSSPFPPGIRLPKLTGVAIEREDTGAPSKVKHLRFVLNDPALRDIFAELCIDIVRAGATADTEAGVIVGAISRTWRWHHLLKSGGSGILSEQRQKGLLGELAAMQTMADEMGIGETVRCWEGPFDKPKDFSLPGSTAVESKAVRGTEAPFVQVTSEWQLDTAQLDAVFLSVAEITRGVETDSSTLTLPAMVEKVRDRVVQESPDMLFEFEAALFAAGFRPEDDYSEFWWEIGGLSFYEVGPEFPRIEGNSLPAGIAKVSYRVELANCKAFKIDRQMFLNRLNPNARS